ncbi:hypothetical protein Y032_0016g3047 [Ancylostoma ceylanicum]|uniref:Uncharacterized protein n=1 Tax=Ancylostoma ceylanicum TaxID=53326 RepID=A0A016V7I0_9BILA|nr:hypothetical protein Y032_0016g3047 [Ancylostoma ceylanicum]
MPVTLDNPPIPKSNSTRSFTAVFLENAHLFENLLLGVVVCPRLVGERAVDQECLTTSSSLIHSLFERNTWQLEEEANRRTISLG